MREDKCGKAEINQSFENLTAKPNNYMQNLSCSFKKKIFFLVSGLPLHFIDGNF